VKGVIGGKTYNTSVADQPKPRNDSGRRELRPDGFVTVRKICFPQIARESELLPRSGDVLRVTKAASVQFSQPMLFRVIRVHDWMTYDGWAWLDGYQLNAAGDAVERRSIFVQLSGLQPGYLTRQRVPARLPAMV